MLAEDLDRFLRSEPIPARPNGFLGRTWCWCRRKPALATVGALAALLLPTLAIGGPIVASQQRAAAERYRRLACAGEVKAAHDWWRRAKLQQATNALDRHLPQRAQRDLREFTWRYVNRFCQPYRQIRTLGAARVVRYLATTPDGRWLAESGGFDLISIWDLRSHTNAPAHELRTDDTGESYYAGPVPFSPDGRYFVTAGFSTQRSTKGLQIWDRTTW